MTETDAAKLITALVTAFPNEWRFLDDAQQKSTRAMYRHMLRDLDAKTCAGACARLTATCKKMPSIAEIREATAALANGRRIPGGEAWGLVLKAIARFGRNKAPAITDPVLARAVDAMGWRYLCNMTDDHAVADRARFIELYDRLAKSAHEDETVGEIAPPIPIRQLPAGPHLIRDIVAGLLPTSDSEPTDEHAARVLDQHHQPE